MLTLLVVTLTMSACTLPIDSDAAPTTTRTTSDDLRPVPGPGVATASDTAPASGTSVATVDTVLRDADAGWQHGALVVGGMTTASDGTILLAGSLHARVLAFLSHLPQLTASALMGVVGQAVGGVAGDATEIG